MSQNFDLLVLQAQMLGPALAVKRVLWHQGLLLGLSAGLEWCVHVVLDHQELWEDVGIALQHSPEGIYPYACICSSVHFCCLGTCQQGLLQCVSFQQCTGDRSWTQVYTGGHAQQLTIVWYSQCLFSLSPRCVLREMSHVSCLEC